MNKQELIEKINRIAIETPFPNSKIVDHLEVIKLIEQLDKPEKITIPQHIANWIEKCKAKGKSLLTALLYTPEKVNSWVNDPDNQEIFAIAWLFGYEVKKEPKYLVKMKGMASNFRFLKYNLVTENYYMGNDGEIQHTRLYHTRKQLEENSFSWVFDCEGIEIEEIIE